ncbi:hypothetical protein ACKEU9_15390 [Yersinia enterocolitica]
MKEQKDINTVIERHHDVMYKEQVIEYADYTLKSDSHYNKDGLLHLINFEKKDARGTIHYGEYKFHYDDSGFLDKIEIKKINNNGSKSEIDNVQRFESKSVGTTNPKYTYTLDAEGRMIEILEQSDKSPTEKTIDRSVTTYGDMDRTKSVICEAKYISDKYSNFSSVANYAITENGKESEITDIFWNYEGKIAKTIEETTTSDMENRFVRHHTTESFYSGEPLTLDKQNTTKFDRKGEVGTTEQNYRVIGIGNEFLSNITTIDIFNGKTGEFSVEVKKINKEGESVNKIHYSEPNPNVLASSFLVVLNDAGELVSINKYIDSKNEDITYLTKFDADYKQGNTKKVINNIETGEESIIDKYEVTLSNELQGSSYDLLHSMQSIIDAISSVREPVIQASMLPASIDSYSIQPNTLSPHLTFGI